MADDSAPERHAERTFARPFKAVAKTPRDGWEISCPSATPAACTIIASCLEYP